MKLVAYLLLFLSAPFASKCFAVDNSVSLLDWLAKGPLKEIELPDRGGLQIENVFPPIGETSNGGVSVKILIGADNKFLFSYELAGDQEKKMTQTLHFDGGKVLRSKINDRYWVSSKLSDYEIKTFKEVLSWISIPYLKKYEQDNLNKLTEAYKDGLVQNPLPIARAMEAVKALEGNEKNITISRGNYTVKLVTEDGKISKNVKTVLDGDIQREIKVSRITDKLEFPVENAVSVDTDDGPVLFFSDWIVKSRGKDTFGLILKKHGKFYYIRSLVDGYPAHVKNIPIGSKILRVDGKDAEGMKEEEIKNYFTQKEQVEVLLELPNGESQKTTLKK